MYNLKLQRNDSEVQDLYSRPKHEIRLQRRQIDVLELASHSSSATTLCNSHECKEQSQSWHFDQPHDDIKQKGSPTNWSKDQLIEADPLKGGNSGALFRNRKRR